MFGKKKRHGSNHMGAIIVTIIGMCAGLCIGAVACIGIVHFLSR